MDKPHAGSPVNPYQAPPEDRSQADSGIPWLIIIAVVAVLVAVPALAVVGFILWKQMAPLPPAP